LYQVEILKTVCSWRFTEIITMWKLWVVLLALFGTLTGCRGQSSSDCSNYCHKSCSDYFNQSGDEFSRCVTANVNCDCGLHPTARVVFWVIGTIIVFIIFAACYRGCKRKMGSGGSRQYPAVVATVPTPYTAPYTVGAIPPSRPYSAGAVSPAPYPGAGAGITPRPYSAGGAPTPYPFQQSSIGPTVPYNTNPSAGYEFGRPFRANMSPVATPSNANIMQTGGFIDPPPSYVQTTSASTATAPPDPDQDPPSYAYSTKYRTYK
jgi:hypothetical protein